jgi:hypothetical protein
MSNRRYAETWPTTFSARDAFDRNGSARVLQTGKPAASRIE